MAGVRPGKRDACDIHRDLALLRNSLKMGEFQAMPRKRKRAARIKEIRLDVAQYLAEWMPGDLTCFEAWVQEHDITESELLVSRPIPLFTSCDDNLPRLQETMEISRRFFAEWRLRSWTHEHNTLHGITPTQDRVYEEYRWLLAGQTHSIPAMSGRFCTRDTTRRQWVRRWRRRWGAKLVKRGFRDPMPNHVMREKARLPPIPPNRNLFFGTHLRRKFWLTKQRLVAVFGPRF